MTIARNAFRLPALAQARTVASKHADGVIELAHPDLLDPELPHLGYYLRLFARTRPERVFIDAFDGALTTLIYAAAQAVVDRLSQALLDATLSPERPLAIVAENSIAFACLKLAAMQVEIPVAPISVAYARHEGGRDRLAYLIDLLRPGAIAIDGSVSPGRLKCTDDVVRIALPGAAREWRGIDYDAFAATPSTEQVEQYFARVQADETAKILFTSGSTGMPKGVITTHRMLVSNIVVMRQLMPFLAGGPTIVDWLPWNHCFGGNYNFNLALVNGGSYYIDPGRPVDGVFDQSRRLLETIQPSLYLNVPVGFERLCAAIETNPAFAENIFERIDAFFYAGSTMPAPLWSRLAAVAERTLGHGIFMFTSYGSTESTSGHLLTHWPTDGPSQVGVPLPGSSVKLIPCGDGQYEIRLKGPNITPGYFAMPSARRRCLTTRAGPSPMMRCRLSIQIGASAVCAFMAGSVATSNCSPAHGCRSMRSASMRSRAVIHWCAMPLWWGMIAPKSGCSSLSIRSRPRVPVQIIFSASSATRPRAIPLPQALPPITACIR